MILFDTETTNLTGPKALDLAKQPHIIEFCAVKLDDKTLIEKAMIDFLIDPGVPVTPESERITGITNSMLKGKAPFVGQLEAISDFFLGERIIVAHNCAFDCELMEYELRRCGKLTQFPWPPVRVCTVEASFHIQNRRLSLGDLYKLATGNDLVGAHKAIVDVRALAVCLRWLKDKKKIKL